MSRLPPPRILLPLLAILSMAMPRVGTAPLAGQTPPDDPAPGERIVSLVPGASRLLVALGVGDRIVGRTTDDTTPELASVPSVGRVLEPDLERVAAVEPTLIVAWAGLDAGPLRRVAEAQGAEVVPVRLDRLEDLEPTLTALGRVLDRAEEARARLAELRTALDAVRRPLRPGAPGVLWVTWPEPPVVAGPDSFPADLLRLLGLPNVGAGLDRPWPRPSWEWLVSAPVELVVWPVGPGMPPVDSLPDDSPWRRVPALAEGRVVEPPLDLVHEVGPRLPLALDTLASLLAPYRTPP